jgi:hypothetical protein
LCADLEKAAQGPALPRRAIREKHAFELLAEQAIRLRKRRPILPSEAVRQHHLLALDRLATSSKCPEQPLPGMPSQPMHTCINSGAVFLECKSNLLTIKNPGGRAFLDGGIALRRLWWLSR